MVRVGDAHVGGGLGGDVGDHVVVDVPVVGVKPQVYGDVGVQGLKIGDGLFVDVGLGHVGVVLGPEGDLILPRQAGGGLRHGEGRSGPGCRGRRTGTGPRSRARVRLSSFFIPWSPPCDNALHDLFRKARNSRISGTLRPPPPPSWPGRSPVQSRFHGSPGCRLTPGSRRGRR